MMGWTDQDLKQTRFYQDVLDEGKQERDLEIIPGLARLGLTAQQIAEVLSLELKQVEDALQQRD